MKSFLSRTPVLCLSLLALAACGKGKDQAPAQPPPPEVGVITAQPQSSPLTKDLVGRLSPFRSADVRARVAGVLLKRVYDEGTDVKKGQLLFQIDPAPLKATLAMNVAALAQAQATYTNNKVAAQRAHSLAPQGYVSKSDIDTADANERTAAASVQQARANVDTAKINLDYASVTSPINGRAGQQQVTEGALVGQGEATLLTTVDQIDPLYVNFTVGVGELDQIRRSQSDGHVTLTDQNKATVQVTLPDGTPYGQNGTLDFSDTTVNPSTGSVNLRAVVPNPQHSLLPGTYVTLIANLGEQHGVYKIPQAAVQRDTAGSYVLVVDKDGKVVRKNVTAGQQVGSDWLVSGGISAGDQIVVSGIQQAKEGAPAKATPWQPDASANSAQHPTPAGASAASQH